MRSSIKHIPAAIVATVVTRSERSVPRHISGGALDRPAKVFRNPRQHLCGLILFPDDKMPRLAFFSADVSRNAPVCQETEYLRCFTIPQRNLPNTSILTSSTERSIRTSGVASGSIFVCPLEQPFSRPTRATTVAAAVRFLPDLLIPCTFHRHRRTRSVLQRVRVSQIPGWERWGSERSMRSGLLFAEAGTRAAAPFSASGILPSLRFGRFLLTKPNTFLHNRDASVATLRWCSESSRNAVRIPSGMSVRLRGNPQCLAFAKQCLDS